ncbi:hypothetical protein HS088_TW15G01285 [Tripterygium wilfordii]|uniref:Uncharacterized protein n=1 Tax=Tripterygium wilfordii TaxID=458696 RepID=A0A7J7CP51_TRIWF|nr:hypothetical protein HS088_TW15G01285 [Tripterygium wilfordii]
MEIESLDQVLNLYIRGQGIMPEEFFVLEFIRQANAVGIGEIHIGYGVCNFDVSGNSLSIVNRKGVQSVFEVSCLR